MSISENSYASKETSAWLVCLVGSVGLWTEGSQVQFGCRLNSRPWSGDPQEATNRHVSLTAMSLSLPLSENQRKQYPQVRIKVN